MLIAPLQHSVSISISPLGSHCVCSLDGRLKIPKMGPAVQYTEPLTQQHPHITFTTRWHPLPHREQNYYSSKVLMIISVTVESRQKPCQEQSCNTKQCNCRSLAFTCNLVTGPQYSLCLGPRSRRRRPAEVARCPFVVVVVVVVVVWLLSASGCGVLGYCCL